jgi:hypothetical protein
MAEPVVPSNDPSVLRPAVNCPRCRRLFNVPSGRTEGDVITCPFCAAPMLLRVRSMLVAEPVEAA